MCFRPVHALRLALAALLLTVSSVARADDVAIAERLFLEGKRLMDEGSYPAACEKFKAARDLDTTATGTLLNLALCHEKTKKYATAWAEFRQVIAESHGRREDRVTMARTHEAKLAPLLSFVVLRVPAAARTEGLKIELDRAQVIPEASWGVELPIDPGKHVFAVSATGKVARDLDLVVGDAGDRKTLEVPPLADAPAPRVPPAPRPAEAVPPPAPSTQRTVGFAVGGAGVAALAVGAVFGGLAMGSNSDADDAARACPNGRCPNDVARSRAVNAIDEATSRANVANVAFGAGLALLAGGVVLVLTAKPSAALRAMAPGGVGGTW